MLRDAGRAAKFKTYITALVKGEEPKAAFTAQFGEVKAFGRALETYARKGMTYTTRTRASAAVQPKVAITALPASAEDLLLREAAMHVGVRDEDAPQLLARVRAEAAKFPSDPYAQRVLAEAETLYGDRKKGAALLDGLLRTSPSDVELLYLRGMKHVLDARAADEDAAPDYKAARTWFVRAHKADEYHFPTLARYAESLRTDGRFDSDNTVEIVLLAQELAPQVQELSVNAANLLIMRGRFEQAESLLLPLASSPHNGGLAKVASAMLRQARAKSKTPLPDNDEATVETASQ
jgi:Flp pilus assembly protein TadD